MCQNLVTILLRVRPALTSFLYNEFIIAPIPGSSDVLRIESSLKAAVCIHFESRIWELKSVWNIESEQERLPNSTESVLDAIMLSW